MKQASIMLLVVAFLFVGNVEQCAGIPKVKGDRTVKAEIIKSTVIVPIYIIKTAHHWNRYRIVI